MSKETIAVDVDEVLFPFLDEFLKDYNARYSTSILKESFLTYDLCKPLGIDAAATVTTIHAFHEMLESQKVEPLEKSKESVLRLASHANLAIVTARHPQFKDSTVDWLKEHYGDSFTSVTHIGYAPIMEKPITKAEICKEIGAIAMIDDSPGHIRQCAESGIEGILFGDYPWNQVDSLPPNAVRCPSWPNVLEHFGLAA